MSVDELAQRIRARAAETGADVVILPEGVDQQTGKGVYAQDTLLLVKRLRHEGINADYLDRTADRYFVTQKSALLTLAATVGIGIATNAAWDGVKKVVSLMRGNGNSPLTIIVTDASDTAPAEVSVSGSPAEVMSALEKLKARQLLPSMSPAPLTAGSTTASDEVHGEPGEGEPPTPHSLKQIEGALSAGAGLIDRSRRLLEEGPEERAEGEAAARRALSHFRSALDWAEDTDREDEAHAAMDAAGRWTCETFGCELEYTNGTYYRTCPVDPGHNRVGFSVGGVATRICSLCDRDFSDCEHDPAREYLTPGGSSPLGYCRVCMEQGCTEHRRHLQYPARPRFDHHRDAT
ncbi:hypothetical protein [Nocardioides sp. B-3]|uniref:hypothetical protein n=1 Tax=Nocardioides sp. B-3 TaxID=2895565 RepID=UPI002152B4E7|nr:hypothetical protein [Nocardioides sp. B-3]UUZ58715.1 hypothetical protein LP418_21765 [Nocardioides sp. B-3]